MKVMYRVINFTEAQELHAAASLELYHYCFLNGWF